MTFPFCVQFAILAQITRIGLAWRCQNQVGFRVHPSLFLPFRLWNSWEEYIWKLPWIHFLWKQVWSTGLISWWLLQNILGEFFCFPKETFCEVFKEVPAKICITPSIWGIWPYAQTDVWHTTDNSFSNYILGMFAFYMVVLLLTAILA